MPYINGTADLPCNGSQKLHRPQDAAVDNSISTLYNVAHYLRSATPSTMSSDLTHAAWGLLAPVWLQRRQQVRELGKAMREAPTFESYEAAALELDELQGHNEWKLCFESLEEEYNPRMIRKQMRRLQKAVRVSDIARLQYLLRTQLSRSLGGMNMLRLYKHSWHGTKSLINDYISTVISSINSLLELTEKAKIPAHESRFHQNSLEDALRYLGRPALTLSGGAKLGMKHVGVVKALWEADLLPNIVSGASAGAILAAIVGAHSDTELQGVLERFPNSDLAVFDPPHVVGTVRWCASRCRTAYETYAWFDMSHLERVMKEWLDMLTFKEAHNKTGRIINICVSSPDSSEPRLLNYMTAPNVFLWSAVCASCSVPYVFQPANIYERDTQTGKIKVWMQGSQQWVDGSLDSDIPQRKLSEMFNVNYFIVSQVNPHVRPFLAAEEEFTGVQPTTKTAPTDTVLRKVVGLVKDDMVYRANLFAENSLLRPLLRGVSIVTQKYTGDINILPEIASSDYLHMMANPTPDFMLDALRSGERATWPKMSQIRNSVAIELALLKAINVLRDRVNFGPDAARARQLMRIESKRGRQRRLRPRRPSFDGRRSLSHESRQFSASEETGNGNGNSPYAVSPSLAAKRNSSAGSLIERFGSLSGFTPVEPPPGGLKILTPQAGVAEDLITPSITPSEPNHPEFLNGFSNGFPKSNGFSNGFSFGADADSDEEITSPFEKVEEESGAEVESSDDSKWMKRSPKPTSPVERFSSVFRARSKST